MPAKALRDRLINASPIEYQRIVLEEVRAGRGVARWVALNWQRNGHRIAIAILARPFAIGTEDDPIYVVASATLQQLIADDLHGLFPTSLVLDERHRQAAVRIEPITHSSPGNDWWADGRATSPRGWLEQSALLVDAIGKASDSVLVSMPWKTWVLGKDLAGTVSGVDRAMNHGQYTSSSAAPRTLGGLHAIQVLGARHSRMHADYSQLVDLITDTCMVDGVCRSTAEVVADPELAPLLSDEGPLTVTRQPGAFDATVFGIDEPWPRLARGASGPAVKRWQEVLREWGMRLDADGSFGWITHAATAALQKRLELLPDGIVDRELWRLTEHGTPTDPAPATVQPGDDPTMPPRAANEIEAIDLSSNNGPVDFVKVAAFGIKILHARCTDGVNWLDGRFRSYLADAQHVGIMYRSAYHFLRVRHLRAQDADAQADAFASEFLTAGCNFDPLLDCEGVLRKPGEPEPSHNLATAAEWDAAIELFERRFRARTGRGIYIYTYKGWWESRTGPELHAAKWAKRKLHIANYNERDIPPPLPAPWTTFEAHQYAAGKDEHGKHGRLGVVPGVIGYCDRSRFRM